MQELKKHNEPDHLKPMIEAMSKAQNSVQQLLVTINESMSINDIIDVQQVRVK
jgi:macrodomain Ter protein organizer (MatP/YcbG family)